MTKIRITKLKVKNFRSFGEEQIFDFPNDDYQKPVAIIGYNNVGKTNLINAIRYGLYESVKSDTFELKDFHNLVFENSPQFELDFEAEMGMYDENFAINTPGKNITKLLTIGSTIEDGQNITSKDSGHRSGPSRREIGNKKTNIKKYTSIFYINFHKIKEEILTNKGSWGGLKSFLSKHIDSLIKSDAGMQQRKEKFKNDIKDATNEVLKGVNEEGSELEKFIKNIKNNYTHNLQDKTCSVDFSLPDYEDIFLQMMFKIGLNGDGENLIPISHLGDGYISMFVMAVIQAIAETNTVDKCLFLFEEPESFLHENHQEYFYKMVLCKLAKKHQVIYTTHSDKMIDFFDTKGIIRLDFSDENKQTEKKYNNINELANEGFEDYNDYIQRIEPNLNKILFSKKVILVEGPNDVLVYKYIIEKRIKERIVARTDIDDKDAFAQTYLNFKNIVIIPHHGKTTAHVLINLCKHFKIDFFVITDLDFEDGTLVEKLKSYSDENLMKKGEEYARAGTRNGMITSNWKLINSAGDNIHFNVPKLEKVIGYIDDDGDPIVDKDSSGIWEAIKSCTNSDDLFPSNLVEFLELYALSTSE